MGVAGPGTCGADVEGAHPPDSLPDAGRSATAARRLAGASGGHGGVLPATGLRAANVTGLQWSQVDLARRLAWVHPDQAKARKAIPVPLNAEAVVLVRKQLGKHLTHVFSYRGKPMTRSAPRRGMRRWRGRASPISAGTICGTPGPAGTCRTARRCSRCRNWGAGRVRRWCGGTRISPRITWRPMRSACVRSGPWVVSSRHVYGTGLKDEGPSRS